MAKKKPFPRHAFHADPGAKGQAVAAAPDNLAEKAWKSALSFVLVIGSALAVKFFVVDVYYIPSGSMETALHGRPDGGDRIVCAKLPYRWRAPERWEIGVFEFPTEYARARLRDAGAKPHHIARLADNRGQNYIKRFVGLPGETIRFSRGDLWLQGADASTWTRLVKPAGVQRGAWIPVYAADFAGVSSTELAAFWHPGASVSWVDAKWPGLSAKRGHTYPDLAPDDPTWTDSGWTRAEDGTLRADPAGGGAIWLAYIPRVPDGDGGMARVPGIVDRYVVRQAVRFYCDPSRQHPAGAPWGKKGCGGRFTRTVDDQRVAGACPHCGAFLMEDAVEFYHRRTSLPVIGEFGRAGSEARQKETIPRATIYNTVADLRIVADVRFPQQTVAPLSSHRPVRAATFFLQLNDQHYVASWLENGHTQINISGMAEPVDVPFPAPVATAPDAWRTLELHRADGVVRVYLDNHLLGEWDAPPDDGERAVSTKARVRANGVRLVAEGGPVEWRRVRIDRDIHYYSGAESNHHGGAANYPMTGGTGEIHLRDNEFLGLGDNAPSSADSRNWGPVPAHLLRGSALATWWPLHRTHRLNQGLRAE